MSVKIVHCADVHLDSVFSFLDSSVAQCRREDLRSAFSKCVALVKEKDADLFIISGDLFDSENVSRDTAEFVRKKLEEISDKEVFICAGNHDPLKASSYLSVMNFGEHVHIFGGETECIKREEYDIYGVSFTESYARKSFLEDFKAENPDKINIMVMHGDFTSSEYNLITKTQLENCGIDYMALGHVHTHQVINAGRCTAVYPGCPEGRGFDETGQKGAAYAEVSKSGTKAEFIPISRRKLHETELDVTEAENTEEIIEMLQDSIKDENDLYKFVLKGETDIKISCDVYKDNLDAFFVKIYDRTEPKRDLKKCAEEFSLKGLFVKKAFSEIDKGTDEELVKLAIKIGLDAMNGR
ncbi:MAG: exonuclease SbcCD subunit D [Ruminococcaceae bacterium]|nr:exonuclease SbcCD subunit D [Oscillospiraceae bacterium]